jgi:glycosyltransferase involved in cell wall biosynthesis
VYDPVKLGNLRHFSSFHFHGHSVGGTNPSLLEAMACGCSIIAHDNVFNKAVLGNEARYFSNINEIRQHLTIAASREVEKRNSELNVEKVRSIYNWARIIDSYEALMLAAFASRR